MPGLFTTIILVAAVSPPCRCFKPVTVSEQGREIPAWTSYRYLDSPAPAADTLVREYVLQEQDQVSQHSTALSRILYNISLSRAAHLPDVPPRLLHRPGGRGAAAGQGPDRGERAYAPQDRSVQVEASLITF